MTGQTISHYRLMAELGRGGVGVVYKARDTHLDRPVAIKVLPPERVADPERRRRFVQEAKAASALNHPNLVHIYDIDTDSGVEFIAMEYVEGRTLHDVIGRKGLKLGETLQYAVQIADALAAAHRAGIVHRDIKPSNIMVSEKGLVKVLDFGLAKLVEQAEAAPNDATQTMGPRTEEGTIVGTAAYMSPEQAEGKRVDARSDIFSFGSVLYEMVTGQRAFQGENRTAILSAILHKEPAPISETARDPVAPELQNVIARCLRKDPQRRIQHLDDVKLALEELKQESVSGSQGAYPVARERSRPRGVWTALLAVLLVAGFVAWRTWRAGPEGAKSTEPLRALPLTTLPGWHRSPSFSPDGDHVAFAWTGPKQDNADIYVQQIGAGSPLRLTTDPGTDYSPVWSPDGRWVAFLRGERTKSELRLIPPLGGPERKLAEVRPQLPHIPVSLAWCPDSQCMVVTDTTSDEKRDALFMISLETGEKRQLTHPPPGAADSSPAVSPDGSWLVFRRDVAPFNGELYRLPLGRGRTPGTSAGAAGLAAAGEPRKLTTIARNASHPAWMPDGKEILYSAKGGLWRVVVAGDKPESAPARLPFAGEDGIMPVVSRPQSGRPPRLVYVRSFEDLNIWRVETSAAGARASSPPAVSISSTRREWMPEFSPDGRRVAFISDRSGESEVWLADSDGSNAIQLTFMGAGPGAPRWSPNGELIVFHSNPESPGQAYVIPSAGGKPRNVISLPSNVRFPSFSRDGQWIYFTSDRAGSLHIWKVPTIGGDAVEVSKNDGSVALESPDGAYIYYLETIDRPSALWRLAVSGGAPVKVLEGVILGSFVVLDRGIYYMDRPSGETRLQYFDMATGRSTTVARNLGNVFMGLTAPLDGRAILYTRVDSSVDDLMLVENFR